MSGKYDALDTAIVDFIAGQIRADAMAIRYHLSEAIDSATDAGRDPYRVLDGRLQALRKKGAIYYASGAWRTARHP